MKCLIGFIVFFGLFNQFGLAQTKEQKVLELSKKKFEWLIHKQVDSLSVILDDQLFYIHSNGWIETQTDVIQDIITEKLIYKSVDVKESGVRLFDNGTAIVTGKGKFSGVMSGNAFDIELLYTEVYIQRGGNWFLVSRHANRLP